MIKKHHHARYCYCSVTNSYLTLRDPMDFSTLGSSASTIPRVCSNSCPLSWWCYLITISSSTSPFSFSFILSQHQSLFQRVGSLHQVANWCVSRSTSTRASASASAKSTNQFILELTGLNSLQCKRLSGVFCSTTFQKHQSLGTEPSLWTNSHICTWLLKKLYPFFFFNGPSWLVFWKWCLGFLICF